VIRLLQTLSMTLRKTLSKLVKVLACAAFAFALAFSPPSAAHASSGGHDDHQTISYSADHNGSQRGMVSQADVAGQSGEAEQSGVAPGLDDGGINSENCCSGICVSVALNANNLLVQAEVSGGRHLLLDSKANSNDASRFLRPPKSLI